MSRLERERSALVLIDVQEAFRGYDVFDAVAAAGAKLLEGARLMDVPRTVTEQYPRGLGHTASEVGLQGEPVVEKSVFSAARADGFDLGRAEQVVVCGIEAHVCVAQTVLDLLADGREVHVPVDAVGSRHERDYDVALRRLAGEGAVLTSVEAVLFELLGQAGVPEFKAVQGLVK